MMANYYVVGLGAVTTLSILSILYDSFSMDMYQCTADSRHLSGTRPIANTRVFAPRPTDFDIRGNDVLVLLHIQKTGGSSFGRHLARHLDTGRPCQCKKEVKACHCPRPGTRDENWLFSEFSTGWACGVHADWTELTNCVPHMLNDLEDTVQQRRYFYMTVLRDPLTRYLSEWQHVARGATWKTALHMCGGRRPTEEELPLCYQGLNWANVSLPEFLDCPHNLASNRQTRMLADLATVGCYNRSAMPAAEREQKLLDSAKANVRRLAFLGILEYQEEMQLLFESTFGLAFLEDFVQVDLTQGTSVKDSLTDDQVQRIRELNSLDFALYDYAKDLFLERVAAVKLQRSRRTPVTKPKKSLKQRRRKRH